MAKLNTLGAPALNMGVGGYGIPGMESIMPQKQTLDRASLGALIAKDPVKAAQVLAGMGISPEQFMQVTETLGKPGQLNDLVASPEANLQNALRSALEGQKNRDANPNAADNAKSVELGKRTNTLGYPALDMGVGGYSLGDTGSALNVEHGAGPTGVRHPGDKDRGPASVDPQGRELARLLFTRTPHKSPPGTKLSNEPVNTPDMPAFDPFSSAPYVPPAASSAGSKDIKVDPSGKAAVQTTAPVTPIAASPAEPAQSGDPGNDASSAGIPWLMKTLQGEDAGPPPIDATSGYRADQGGREDTPVQTTSAADAVAGSTTPSLDSLSNLLSGIQAPPSPDVHYPATPATPQTQPIKGSAVQDLLQMIFGTAAKGGTGPQTLSAALRG